MIFVANFLGVCCKFSNRPNYKEPVNVKISLTDYLLFYIMGSSWFISHLSKKMGDNYADDYFGGVRIWIK